MRRWSFRGLLMLVTVGIVLATVAALELSTYSELRRLSREEARARAGREVARALGVFDGIAPQKSLALVRSELSDWSARHTQPPLAVRLVLPREADSGFAEESAGVWREALAGGSVEVILPRSGDALAARPLRTAAGEVVGVVEASIPAASVLEPVNRFLARTARTAVAIAGLALVLSVLLGRRLAEPLAALARRAAAMGEGDLVSPLPLSGGREVRALASTLDEMRRSFVSSEAELARKRDELAAVLGGIAEGVYAVDRDRRVLYLNPPAAKMLGVDPAAGGRAVLRRPAAAAQ